MTTPKPTLNEIIKTSITQALLQLLQAQEFERISITDITKRAGVSRISFYRNFSSKQDILMQHLYGQLMTQFAKITPQTTRRDLFLLIFEWVESVADTVDLLYQRDLSHIVLQFVRDCCGAKPEQDDDTAYHNSLIMGVVFGALDEWIRRGRKTDSVKVVDDMEATLRKMVDGWHKTE